MFLFSLSTANDAIEQFDISPQNQPKSKFLPAQVNSPYYASFGVHFSYANFTHPQLFNVHSLNSLIFTLDMGWLLNEEKGYDTLIGLYLDGAAGGGKSNALYGLFGGVKIGGRLWDGRVIPFLKLGMKLTHFPFEYQNRQFNTYGLDAEVGAFFDVGQGYGINLSYRYGYNYAYQLKLNNIHTSVVMLGFSFYDFSLGW
ncbi:hypothetical protein [Helicobacter kayseriensis]|nr:hypothetical protein [Helicobacter kayseriensis]MCE3049121.1 hypothetical protein [Helicobacter kayseriensis]